MQREPSWRAEVTSIVDESAPSCWVLTDGKQGMESQCLGLAEALGLAASIKRIRPRWPWRVLPPQLWRDPLSALDAAGDRLVPPWPGILIATGRQTVAVSIAIRRASRGATFTVQIQNPTVATRHFDLVVVPRHDRITGANVIVTAGALHRVSPHRLRAAAAEFGTTFAHLPCPRIAVLLGGSNKQFRMTAETMDRLARALSQAARAHGAGLMITPSRRTGAANIRALADRLADVPFYLWDMTGPNPYFAMLGLADAIVVTGDSVNMVTEACASGKPVYVFDLEGGSRKFARFHEALRKEGATRQFTGVLEDWRARPFDEMTPLAAAVRSRFAAHQARQSHPAQAN